MLQERVQNSQEYVLLFDETLNKDLQKKQMDILVRNWDMNKVSSRYYKSVFFGHGTAIDLYNIMESHVQSNLGFYDFIQVSMDGPNVDWALYDRLQDALAEGHDRQLLNIGSCGLHTVHNCFKQGVESTSWEISQILQALYILFKDTPARREDYTTITGSFDFPKKFCSIRWVENISVVNRAIEIRENVKEYVKAVEDKKCRDPRTKSFSTVKEWVADPLGKAKLTYFMYVATPVETFLKQFQTDQPLIPYPSTELLKIFRTLIGRIVKPEIMKTADDATKLLKVDLTKKESLRSLKSIDLGFMTAAELQKHPGSERDRREFREQCMEFVVVVVNRLKEKSPLNYSLVRNLSCLAPEELVQNNELSIRKFRKVLQLLVQAKRLTMNQCDGIFAEFQKFAESVEAMSEFIEFDRSRSRLDTLYFEAMERKKDLQKVWPVLKTLLLLSHGQPSVERSFSQNKHVTTQNLSENTLIARRSIKDHLHHGGGIENVAVSKDLLKSVKQSRLRYSEYLDKQKEDAARKTRGNKRKLEDDTLERMHKEIKQLKAERAMLLEEADKLCLKAERTRTNTLQCVVQSNSLRRTANEKAIEAEDIEKAINQKKKELSNTWSAMVCITKVIYWISCN